MTASNIGDIDAALNDKQHRFCVEYARCLNQTEAARLAGYSDESAHVMGSELLNNPNVVAKIQLLKLEIANRSAMQADQVLSELSLLAGSDIKDYVEFDNEGNTSLKNLRDLPANISRCIKRISVVKQYVGKDCVHQKTNLELHDKVKSLDLLGEYHTLWSQNKQPGLDEKDIAAALNNLADAIEKKDG